MAINFILHNRNHVCLVAEAIIWLQKNGHEINLFDLEILNCYQGAKEEAIKYQLSPIHPITSIDQYIKKNDVVVTLNDWDTIHCLNIFAQLRGRGTILTGIIEGCLWNQANRYRRCDYVLSFSPLAKKIFENRPYIKGVYVVGSPVIEASLNQVANDEIYTRKNYILINYTIPSGDFPRIVDEHWLSRVIGACSEISVPYVVSKHPSKVSPADVEISTLDFSGLIRYASVLVTPSSSVIFEALVHGIPVVLFKSSDQPLQEFGHPKGAFEIIDHYPDLPSAIIRAIESRGAIKSRASRFINEQISIDPGIPSWLRTAKALEDIVMHQSGGSFLNRGRLDYFPVWHFQHNTGLREEDTLVCIPGRDQKGHCLFGLDYVIRKNSCYCVILDMVAEHDYDHADDSAICTLDIYENSAEKKILVLKDLRCLASNDNGENTYQINFAAQSGYRIEVRVYWHGIGKITVKGVYLEEKPNSL